MTFGYLIVVSKNDSVDYLKLAYALALSIKNTQQKGFDKKQTIKLFKILILFIF